MYRPNGRTSLRPLAMVAAAIAMPAMIRIVPGNHGERSPGCPRLHARACFALDRGDDAVRLAKWLWARSVARSAPIS